MKRSLISLFLIHASLIQYGQIIADHTVVDKFDDIPQFYLNEVKKMWLVVAGESHSVAYRTGLTSLESVFPAYAVNVTESGQPESYTTSHLRASTATWGDVNNASGWIYNYGEEDWWTNATAISRTEAGIAYCNNNNLTISAFGFGWCYDAVGGGPTNGTDPVYGVHWYGESTGSGAYSWGLDAQDFTLTNNPVSMDTYLSVTQRYIDYCTANSIPTKVFFTTGPVDDYAGSFGLEARYQGHLKYEHIRNYVKAHPTTILFDYADILCYDDNGTLSTATWNGHSFPVITTTNLGTVNTGHIGTAGSIRLAKAMWWMLARIAGWNGEITDIGINKLSSPHPLNVQISGSEILVRINESYLNSFLTVYDSSGSLIFNQKVTDCNLILSASGINPGICIFKLSKQGYSVVKKIVII